MPQPQTYVLNILPYHLKVVTLHYEKRKGDSILYGSCQFDRDTHQ